MYCLRAIAYTQYLCLMPLDLEGYATLPVYVACISFCVVFYILLFTVCILLCAVFVLSL